MRPVPVADVSAITIRSEHDGSGVLSDDVWKEARNFLAVAKVGTLAGAARSLRVSTLTVSRSIRRLQDRLGSTLFVATNQGITLTPKGEELADVLLLVDKHLYSVAAEVRSESNELRGVVRVSVTEGLAAVFLAPALRQLSERYPKIEVIIKAPISKDSLRRNQTDIMVGFMLDQSKDVTMRPLGFNHLLPCAGRSYLERHGMPTLRNIGNHEFVDSEQYSPQSTVWAPWHALIKRGRCRHRADTSMVYAMMVREGIGIGLLSNYATSDPGLIPLDLPSHVSVPLFATALTERLRSKPVQTVFDFVSALFGPKNPWFVRSPGRVPFGDASLAPSMFDFWRRGPASPPPPSSAPKTRRVGDQRR